MMRLLRLINNSCHHEDEDCEVCDGENDFFVFTKKQAINPQPLHHSIIAQKPQGPKNAEKAAGFSGEGRQEGNDCHYVRPVEKRVKSSSLWRLMSRRAEKSISIRTPKTTSKTSVILLEGTKEVAIMKRTVVISKPSKPYRNRTPMSFSPS